MVALGGGVRLLQGVQGLLLGLDQRNVQLVALAGRGDRLADAVRLVENQEGLRAGQSHCTD